MSIDDDHTALRRIRMAMAVFRESIQEDQLRLFRGAMIGQSGSDPLFHNHRSDGYHYRYPLIQYRLIEGHPAVLGIDEGARRVAGLFGGKDELICRIGSRTRRFSLSSLAEWEDEAGLSVTPGKYIIENWLPLNGANYREFQQTEGAIARLEMLQRILTGNILSFASGMDIFFDRTVECTIHDIERNGLVRYKDVELMCFSASFITDAVLPQWIGLGKSASLNHGIVIRHPH